MNTLHALPYSSLNINFYTTLPSTPRSSQMSFVNPSRTMLLAHMHATCPANHILDSHRPNSISWEVQTVKFWLCRSFSVFRHACQSPFQMISKCACVQEMETVDFTTSGVRSWSRRDNQAGTVTSATQSQVISPDSTSANTEQRIEHMQLK
jgi:hypothetical protein